MKRGKALPADVLERVRRLDSAAIAEWIVREGAQTGGIEELAAGFAEALAGAGLPIDRLTIGVPILLPHVAGMQVRWYRGRPVERIEFPATAETLRAMEASPVRAAYQDGAMTRCRIGPQRSAGDYPIVDDLRGDGFTDYVALPVRFSDGTFKALSVATRAPGGFADSDVEALARLTTNLAPVLEVRALRHLARSLLNVYVGPTAGERVLDGQIRRGEGTTIQAVIWFSDLRSSTDLSMTLDGPAHIALLNEFFGAVTSSVSDHGGEVLKYIGDAVLAIFPCRDLTGQNCSAPHEADRAARDALARIATINRRAAEAGRPAIDIGIALHVGNAFFGNVGGEDRLDFTVIGPAVNLASRIESVSAESGRRLLVSQAFAEAVPADYQPLGAFQFKGIDGWQMVYASAAA